LVQWKYGRWYKSIYELPATDRPADVIIETDVDCDKWYDWYLADVARRSAKNGQSGRAVDLPQFNGGITTA
jgi:hypothetical protein